MHNNSPTVLWFYVLKALEKNKPPKKPIKKLLKKHNKFYQDNEMKTLLLDAINPGVQYSPAPVTPITNEITKPETKTILEFLKFINSNAPK